MNEHDLIENTVRDVLADGVFLCVRLGADTPLIEACSAAVRGGLKVLEITLTTPGAIEAITHFAHGGEAIACPESRISMTAKPLLAVAPSSRWMTFAR